MEKQTILAGVRLLINQTGSIIFLFAFVILFFTSYEICDYFYPYAWEKENDVLTKRGHIQANQWNLLRYTIYDAMFLLLSISTLWIKNRFSFAVSVFVSIVVLCSLIDKAQGIHERNIYDAIVILGGVFCLVVVYKAYKNFNNEKTKT